MTVVDEVGKWLAKHGYPFELKVGKTLSDAGWEVEHSRLFSDVDTAKTRELDIVANVHAADSRSSSIVHVNWCVECKSNIGKPWVVFTSRKDAEHIAGQTYMVPGQLAAIAILKGLEATGILETFRIPERIGHGVVSAFSDAKVRDPTSAFSATLGVLSAAVALTRSKNEFWLRHAGGAAILNLFVPIVVLDGDLLEMHLDDAGDPVLSEVVEALTWVPDPTSADSSMLVRIVTKRSLPAFAKRAFEDSAALASALLPHAQQLWTDFNRSSEALPR